MSISVLSADEYEPQTFDAVLVRETTAVCIDADEDLLRVFPLEKLNHVDAEPEMLIQGTAIPDSFHGGGRYGIVDVERFPELQQHLEELDREAL